MHILMDWDRLEAAVAVPFKQLHDTRCVQIPVETEHHLRASLDSFKKLRKFGNLISYALDGLVSEEGDIKHLLDIPGARENTIFKAIYTILTTFAYVYCDNHLKPLHRTIHYTDKYVRHAHRMSTLCELLNHLADYTTIISTGNPTVMLDMHLRLNSAILLAQVQCEHQEREKAVREGGFYGKWVWLQQFRKLDV